MPNCPYCRHQLAIFEDGTICPNCKRTYTPEQTAKMPGYDENLVIESIALFAVLMGAGLLEPGCTRVEMFDDGMIITHDESSI